MPLSISIYADRAVSTNSARFVHGILPLIQEKLAKGHELAYIGRTQIAEATGLAAGHVLIDTYPKQAAEVGLVFMAQAGRFGLYETSSGTLRGIASGWVVNPDGWTPRDIPELELRVEPYWVDVDASAISQCMSPVHFVWAKEARAHRLACALLHHAGLNRVWLTKEQAAEILGKGWLTGYRALKDLERLGYATKHEGGWWVDLSPVLYNGESGCEPHADVQEQAKEHALLRESVFTRQGWETWHMAREARRFLALARERGDVVRPEYAAVVGRSLRQAVLHFARLLKADPYATGRPCGI